MFVLCTNHDYPYDCVASRLDCIYNPRQNCYIEFRYLGQKEGLNLRASDREEFAIMLSCICQITDYVY